MSHQAKTKNNDKICERAGKMNLPQKDRSQIETQTLLILTVFIVEMKMRRLKNIENFLNRKRKRKGDKNQ